MATLVSPGQSITVSDMSIYVSTAAGTVPLVVLATAQDKTAPDGSSAYGTTKANAGKLQAFTSQRELSAALGYASFQQSSSGTPLNGDERNEYGLLAAYSALGAANSLYAVRADIDLNQLASTTNRPEGTPPNGTFWLDLSTTAWGVNEWDGTNNVFVTKTPIVITSTGDANIYGVPKSSIGTIGSYAVNVTDPNNSLYYKNAANNWVRVGSTDWQASWATVTGTNTVTSSTAFVVNSTLSINGTTVSLLTAQSLSAVSAAINAAAITGVTTTTTGNRLNFVVTAASASNGSGADGKIHLVDGANTPLAVAGITANYYYAPQIARASYVGVPSWRSTDTVAAPTGSVYIKTSAQGNGASIAVKKYSTLTESWVSVAAPIYASTADALYNLDAAQGGIGIAGGSVIAKTDVSATTGLIGVRLMFRHPTAKTTSLTGGAVTGSFSVGNTFTIQATKPGYSVLFPFTCTIPANSNGNEASQFVAAISAANIPNVSATLNASGTVTITHATGGDVVLLDGAVDSMYGTNGVLAAAGFTTNTSGVRVDAAVPGIILSNWVAGGAGQPYTYSFYAPFLPPADGTLWYYGDPATVDIMINDGGWKGYQNVTNDARGYNLTSTDVGGVIVTASMPMVQTDNTGLVAGDLWLDTSDLVNYPALYRYNGIKWVAIDNTDQTGQNGIVFADARWDTSGTVDPVIASFPSTTTMLTSNYIDLDAPDARLYPRGTLLFNTRRSGFNVKQYLGNYFNSTSYPNVSLPAMSGTWQTVSGNKFDGSMFAGPAAQRAMVVKAMQAAVLSNTQIREEQFMFNIIAAPGYPELIDEMVSLNNDRANTAFVIGDTPMTLEANAVAIANWANDSDGTGLATADPYLGVYYPSAVSSDVRGNTVIVPPSHVMLRTFIRNDSVSFPWFAPAGVRRGLVDNATDIGYVNKQTGEFIRNSINQGLRDSMYQNKVNPITILPGVGLTVFGQKTRNPVSSSLDRVNVARLVNYIRTILAKVGYGFLFEPNDKITRDQIKRIIEGAMNDLVAKRGIYDYLVVCDTTNNTPARVAANELYVDIAIEPTKDVEFIYIPIRLLNPGSIAAGQLGK